MSIPRLLATAALTSLAFLAVTCTSEEPTAPAAAGGSGAVTPYDPYRVVLTSELKPTRGLQPHRATIHLHSVYSHDACDEKGFTDTSGKQNYKEGTRNEECFEDLRRALCESGQDVAFLTDHVGHYPDFEYPEVLLYKQGDTLIEKGGKPVANRLACPQGRSVLVYAGIDYSVIAVGLDGHAGATPEERKTIYGKKTPEAVDALKKAGALVLAGYVRRWVEDGDVETLHALPFDGIEVYNPIFNMKDRAGDILNFVLKLKDAPETLPSPELALYTVFEETQETLKQWALLAPKRRLPSFLGANAHQNVFQQKSPDGERIDSYRRMLHWFSNHLLLPEGTQLTIDGAKQAIREGHSYAVFDYLGTPEGFEWRAEAGGKAVDMGGAIEAPASLVARAPAVFGLGSADEPPVITVRILRASGETWEEVASGQGEVAVPTAPPGVYRSEVRILPNHLKPHLGNEPSRFLREVIWIYGNTIHVGT